MAGFGIDFHYRSIVAWEAEELSLLDKADAICRPGQ